LEVTGEAYLNVGTSLMSPSQEESGVRIRERKRWIIINGTHGGSSQQTQKRGIKGEA